MAPAPMKIAVFARSGRPVTDAFMEGARLAGIRVLQQRPIFSASEGTIYGVQGVVVDGLKGDCVTVRDVYRAAGVPVYVFELPRLRAAAGPDKTSETRMTGAYLYSLHDLPQRIGNTAYVGGVLPDRADDYVLVCGQKPGDSAHHQDGAQCATWARETIALCQRQYGLPVVYRPHPRTVLEGYDPAEPYGADRVSLPTEQTIRDALAGAACLVTYNSTSGVDAIDAGVPVFYTAPKDVVAYWQYAQQLGEPIRALTDSERETCLLRFAASQWTTEQMRDGTAARCLFLGEAYPEPQIVTLDAETLAERGAEALAAADEFVNDAVLKRVYVRPEPIAHSEVDSEADAPAPAKRRARRK